MPSAAPFGQLDPILEQAATVVDRHPAGQIGIGYVALAGVIDCAVAVEGSRWLEREIKREFMDELTALARHRKGFHALARAVFGAGYDVELAEGYRLSVEDGDFDWLPGIKLVGREALGGRRGGYHAPSRVVYLGRELSRAGLADTYIEEVATHLAVELNPRDRAGKRGELFRRLLTGERLGRAEVAALRAPGEDDGARTLGDADQVPRPRWQRLLSALRSAWRRFAAACRPARRATKAGPAITPRQRAARGLARATHRRRVSG